MQILLVQIGDVHIQLILSLGISSASIEEAILSKLIDKNSTSSLYSFGLQLSPTINQYILQIVVDSIQYPHSVFYTCKVPPPQLEIELLNPKPIFNPTYLSLSLFLVFKVNNFKESNGPNLQVKDYSYQEITFEFETYDENGILLGSLPTIYLQDKRLDFASQNSELLSWNDTTAQYKCKFKIPFGFGFASNIYVSIFGIVDNQSNFRGYSISQLLESGYPNLITVESTLTFDTSILSTNNLYETGHITIIGKNFESSDKLLIDLKNGTIRTLLNSILNTNSIIIFDSPIELIEKNIITITIQKKDGITHSNSLNVVVEKEPNYDLPLSSSVSSSSLSSSNEPIVTNKPQECKSNCGGISKGECTVNGCVCKSPWIGLDCSSRVIFIDPVINSTIPSTNISIATPDKSYALYYAIISVIGLNELDQNQNIVQSFHFPSWVVNNHSKSQYSKFTNSSYLYTSSISKNNITTNVNVSIDYFNIDTPVNVTFANEILTMSPYSLKYSVNISEYSFASSLNTLQLVLLTSIETNINDDECSSKQFGDTIESNSEYIKMQVNDHSLYGRFIKRVIVDGRVKMVTNSLLDKQYNSVSTQFEQQAYIGINVPYFKKSIQLDPDFSVLIDSKPASDNQEAICGTEKSQSIH
ncbi:hypothetical protein CYY_008083 [Polysphondylium violaceum]|uniref:EGF-like domain-containing protein n=1 Tax=Polysphondylium violaceum TaxID=133409 RepID=A0A8J4V1N0_9MYCE|nr:hypothetical protein CYY_008083 [Polysphondylium violaceum]